MKFSIDVSIDEHDAKCLISNKDLFAGTAYESLLDASHEIVSEDVTCFERMLVLEYLSEDESNLIAISKETDDWSGIFLDMRKKLLR